MVACQRAPVPSTRISYTYIAFLWFAWVLVVFFTLFSTQTCATTDFPHNTPLPVKLVQNSRLHLRGGVDPSEDEPRRKRGTNTDRVSILAGSTKIARFPSRVLLCVLPTGTQLANGLRHLCSCFILARHSDRDLRIGTFPSLPSAILLSPSPSISFEAHVYIF